MADAETGSPPVDAIYLLRSPTYDLFPSLSRVTCFPSALMTLQYPPDVSDPPEMIDTEPTEAASDVHGHRHRRWTVDCVFVVGLNRLASNLVPALITF